MMDMNNSFVVPETTILTGELIPLLNLFNQLSITLANFDDRKLSIIDFFP